MADAPKDFEAEMAAVMGFMERSEELEAYKLARSLEPDSAKWTLEQRQRYQTVAGYLLRLLGGRGQWPPEDMPDSGPNGPEDATPA